MQEKNPLANLHFDHKQFVPGHSVDCVIVAFDREGLKVLVMKWKGPEMFCLPGGFVLMDEDLDKAAIRVLKERAGIELPFLEQFSTFGRLDRRDDDTLAHNLKMMQLPIYCSMVRTALHKHRLRFFGGYDQALIPSRIWSVKA